MKIYFNAYPNSKKYEENNFAVISTESTHTDPEIAIDLFLTVIDKKPISINDKTWRLSKSWSFKSKLSKKLIQTNKAAEILFDDPDDVQKILEFMKKSYDQYEYVVDDDSVEVYPENKSVTKFGRFKNLFKDTTYQDYFNYLGYSIIGVGFISTAFVLGFMSLILTAFLHDSGKHHFSRNKNVEYVVSFIVMLLSIVSAPLWLPLYSLYTEITKYSQ